MQVQKTLQAFYKHAVAYLHHPATLLVQEAYEASIWVSDAILGSKHISPI